ncbi:urease accessory protein [Palleronia aestuarii]|uniref:Urease accessory protein UreD n=1 Tax=Palleronia aestuarii TaxID=568105 RepID=A0A2W7N816_9RHOB|nr:urease accessory protein UreD [Palleronia aestuarii]PZX16291.1 urease accessory protein [Palleronia aestuarii]
MTDRIEKPDCGEAVALASDPRQPRAVGTAILRVARGAGGRPRLATLRQSGAAKLLFPRRRGERVEAVFINTAGGITGGDRFEIAAAAEAGAHLTMTSQAAERAYAAQPGEVGRVRTRLEVGSGARIDWLPQETILYERSSLDRRLDVDLAEDARFLMIESLLFGRHARGEVLRAARVSDRVAIRRQGEPLYLDAIAMAGDLRAHLSRPAIGGGAGAVATLIYIAPDAAAHLEAIRALLPESAGVSAISGDMIALRALAGDGYALRRIVLPVLDRLTGRSLPAVWRL